MKKIFYLSLAILSLGLFSCEKMLNYPPDGAILAEDALKTPDDAQRLLNSCYDVMANVFDGSYQNLAELLSNNLADPNGLDFQSVYNKETNFFTPTTNGVYSDFYYAIYRCNSLLENFDLIEGLSEAEKNRMEAEARFIRAFCHWHVAKLWAQPYGYTPNNSHLGIVIRDKASNLPLPRNTVAEVYTFIQSELEYCASALPLSNGNYATADAAKGALAMLHFQMKNYAQAIAYCDEVIETSKFQSLSIDRFPVECTYTMDLYCDTTTGWGGSYFQLRDANGVVAEFGQQMTDSMRVEVTVDLVSGVLYELHWINDGTTNSENVSLDVLNTEGTSIFELSNQTATAGDVIISTFTAKGSNNSLVALPYSENIFGTVSFDNDQRTDDFIGNYNAAGVLPPNLTLWYDPTYPSNSELENPFHKFISENSDTDRRMSWLSTSGARKTLTRFEDKVVFNVPLIYQTELMLIRAEAIAYAQPARLNEAINDLNMIRARAYTQNNALPSNASIDEVKAAARREYRIETIGEGKWLDYFRRLAMEGVVSNIRNAPWNCPGMALQFPNNEFTGASFVGNPEGGCN
jgi:hypothetical protein